MKPLSPVATGYTLIELVVAMAVLSLLSLMVLQVLHLAQGAWERGTASATRLDAVGTVQQSLRRQLSQLLPVQNPGACGGTARELSFLGPSPDAGLANGTARYRLFVEPAATGARLVAQWCAYEVKAPSCDASAAPQEVLLDKLETVSMAYLHDGAASAGAWGASWADCSVPPHLVRIDVRFSAHDRRVWPVFEVHPQRRVAPDCGFDVVSLSCRRS